MGSALVKAWPLGSGWVIYLGANTLLPNTTDTVADVSVWDQLLVSISRMPYVPASY